MNAYPLIDEWISKRGWTLVTGYQRYGEGIRVVLGEDYEALVVMTDTLSDGDNDACYMDSFLYKVSAWYPTACGTTFIKAMDKLEANLVQMNKYWEEHDDYYTALLRVQNYVVEWEKQKYGPGTTRIEYFKNFEGFKP